MELSEEEDGYISVHSAHQNNENKYVVLIDPLDGSSNIDLMYRLEPSLVYRRAPHGTQVAEDFLQPGNQQVAAGYIVYGTSTMRVLQLDGVNGFT